MASITSCEYSRCSSVLELDVIHTGFQLLDAESGA